MEDQESRYLIDANCPLKKRPSALMKMYSSAPFVRELRRGREKKREEEKPERREREETKKDGKRKGRRKKKGTLKGLLIKSGLPT